MNTSMNAPGSAVPLSGVGKMLVGLVISSMVTDGGVISSTVTVKLSSTNNASVSAPLTVMFAVPLELAV